MSGADLERWIYPFRSIIDAGGGFALSSDWGVSTLNPFHHADGDYPPAAG